MELRHVRYFLAVAEHLNFSKAAQQLHIAQPPLSRQIRQLEDELGVDLFVRDRHHVELTRAGRAFLEEGRKLVVQAGYATEAARHAQKGESGVIRIGIASGLGGVVGKAVTAFGKRYPLVNIECKDIFSTVQNDLLPKHEIDVGFLRPPVDTVNLECEPLMEEEFIVMLPRNHRLARRKSLHLKEVAEEPLIVFDRHFSSGLHDKILGLYSRRGLTPHFAVTHVEAHEEAGAIMVAAGKAIYVGVGAIVTRSVSGVELASVRLDEPDAKIEVYMAWRKDERSTVTLSFMQAVRQVFGRPAERSTA
jgi:DNA-binding transcriptional LysR family regulator